MITRHAPQSFLPLCVVALLLFAQPCSADEEDYDGSDPELTLSEDDTPAVKVLKPGGPASAMPQGEIPEKELLILEDVLKSPDFGGEKDAWGIRLKNKKEADEDEAKTPETPEWMDYIKKLFGGALRFIIILVLAGFAVFALFYFYRKYKGETKSQQFRLHLKELSSSGMSAEALFSNAEQFYNDHKPREAWASCLAGALNAFSINRSFRFPAGATEYACLNLIRSKLKVNMLEQSNNSAGNVYELEEFTELIEKWIHLAYAGEIPAEGAFKRALDFGWFLSSAGNDSGKSGGGEMIHE